MKAIDVSLVRGNRATIALGVAVETLTQIAAMPYAGKKREMALATLVFLHTQAPDLVPVFPLKKRQTKAA